MPPLVSVCIPTYNSSKYLKEAIYSVITQTFDDFELIIVDNNSDDDTDGILCSFNDNRIRYYKNSENIGAIKNHNKCVDLSNGRFIKFLCSDDVFLPNVLYDQATCLLKNTKVALVTCDMYITDYALQNKVPYHFYPGMNRGDMIVRKCIAESINYIGGPSNVMLRRDTLGKIRMDPTYKWVGDLKFFIDILRQKDVYYCNINKISCLYRRHDLSETAYIKENSLNYAEEFRLIKEMNGLNHFNALKFLTKPIEEEHKRFISDWIIKNRFNIKYLSYLFNRRIFRYIIKCLNIPEYRN